MGGIYGEDGEIQQDYDNPKVQQIRDELGEFDYEHEEANYNYDIQVEMRDMVELENHARYQGEWIAGIEGKDNQIRQGKGR